MSKAGRNPLCGKVWLDGCCKVYTCRTCALWLRWWAHTAGGCLESHYNCWQFGQESIYLYYCLWWWKTLTKNRSVLTKLVIVWWVKQRDAHFNWSIKWWEGEAGCVSSNVMIVWWNKPVSAILDECKHSWSPEDDPSLWVHVKHETVHVNIHRQISSVFTTIKYHFIDVSHVMPHSYYLTNYKRYKQCTMRLAKEKVSLKRTPGGLLYFPP